MAIKKLIYADDARRAILEVEPKLAYCIDKVKAVDAVEVVRCKDCKHYWLPQGFCEHERYEYLTQSIWHEDDDFCSYGERKDRE